MTRRPQLKTYQVTCGVCGATGEPGILTRGEICSYCQLHRMTKWPIAHLVGCRNFHKVNLTRLQVLQQSHGDAPCWWEQVCGLFFINYSETIRNCRQLKNMFELFVDASLLKLVVLDIKRQLHLVHISVFSSLFTSDSHSQLSFEEQDFVMQWKTWKTNNPHGWEVLWQGSFRREEREVRGSGYTFPYPVPPSIHNTRVPAEPGEGAGGVQLEAIGGWVELEGLCEWLHFWPLRQGQRGNCECFLCVS